MGHPTPNLRLYHRLQRRQRHRSPSLHSNRIEELKRTGDEGQLSPGWMAILDERSSRNTTVILQLGEEKSLRATELEDAEVEYHAPAKRMFLEDDIWWKWRVKFTDAFQLLVSLDDGDLRAMQWCIRGRRGMVLMGFIM
ncbi:hypothetical protein SI65_10129 [Aspergillus cristatus]|uniref:Uncharacterized protein n=1 Tax=Aspergillus cristatus TaxID=573508 RepID=A0A1E3B0R0_ASPCR|nr:hypothetical protein SI65_10129 [Aspergillus cristatus]